MLPTTAELEAYLDEQLPVEEMSRTEEALRHDEALAERLREIVRGRDAGGHTLGEIWRRQRVGCPDREQLGSFLLGVLDESEADYIRFRLEVLGCRFTRANLDDLQAAQARSSEESPARRERLFDSSAGRLPKGES